MKCKFVIIGILAFVGIARVTSVHSQERSDAAVFRVTITGFTCNRPTVDDPLQRDGVDDEIQLYSDAYELTQTREAFAQPLGFYLHSRSVKSSILGDTNNHPNRIRAGSGGNIFGGNGGFRAADSFPGNTPWSPSPLLQSQSNVRLNRMPPMVVWEGYLVRGLSAVLIIPTIWEMDEQRLPDFVNDTSRIPFLSPGGRWNTSSQSVLSLSADIAKLAAQPKADPQAVISTVKDAFSREVIILKRSAGEPTDRPVGMKDLSDRYAFAPEVLFLTYDVAEKLSGGNFNGAPGVIAIRYRDDGELNGDYTLYLRIERR